MAKNIPKSRRHINYIITDKLLDGFIFYLAHQRPIRWWVFCWRPMISSFEQLNQLTTELLETEYDPIKWDKLLEDAQHLHDQQKIQEQAYERLSPAEKNIHVFLTENRFDINERPIIKQLLSAIGELEEMYFDFKEKWVRVKRMAKLQVDKKDGSCRWREYEKPPVEDVATLEFSESIRLFYGDDPQFWNPSYGGIVSYGKELVDFCEDEYRRGKRLLGEYRAAQ